MTHCVTKAMPIQFIDDNKLKSCRTGLTNHTWPISHHIRPLVINDLGGGQTDRQTHAHTNVQTKSISRNHGPGLKTCSCKPWTNLRFQYNMASIIWILSILSGYVWMNIHVVYRILGIFCGRKVLEFCESGSICECFLALFSLGGNF